MAEDFKVIFEKWKNKDLSTWIKDYENKFNNFENMDYDDDKKEILEQVYKGSKNIRKYFYNNYLNGISDNLNTKSKPDNYKYINFFRQIPTKKNKMEENDKEKELEVDDDSNNNNNYNFSFSSKYYKGDNNYKNKANKENEEDNRDNYNDDDNNNENDYIKINRNYNNRDYNNDKRAFHKNENENNKNYEGGFKIREKGRFSEVGNQEYLKRRDEDNNKKVNKRNTEQKYNDNDNNNNNIDDDDDDNNVFATKNRKITKTIIKKEIEKYNEIPKREVEIIKTENKNYNDNPEREIRKKQKYNYIDEEDDSCHKRTFIDYSKDNNKISQKNEKKYSNIYNNNLQEEEKEEEIEDDENIIPRLKNENKININFLNF